jgi:hypothetical protein
MPLPKQLSAWKTLLDNTLAKGRAKYGKEKYTMKRAMREASRIYRKSKGKTAKKRGGSNKEEIVGGEGEEGDLPKMDQIVGGNDELLEEEKLGGSNKLPSSVVGGRKKRTSKKN